MNGPRSETRASTLLPLAREVMRTVQGKGSFAGTLTQVDDSRKNELRKTFADSARELLRLGLRPEELHEILKQEVEIL